MENQYQEIEINDNQKSSPRPKKRRWLSWLFLFVLMFAVGVGILFYKTGFTFSQININNQDFNGLLPVSESQPLPSKDPARLNILLLGYRGEGDSNGGLLTDSIMIVSIKKSTGQVALISIPRDLYVEMPKTNAKLNYKPIREKINFAFALGEEVKRGAGPIFSKNAVSKVTGLYIDNVIAVNFNAFREIVDLLGGIDIYLDKPFTENEQFSGEFLIDLPAGKNHLNSSSTLYFVRSRYTTSDFDRARRQQLVLMAIRDKALSLGVLGNPVKIYQILDSIGRNIRTDVGIDEAKGLLDFARNIDQKEVIHKVFDTTPAGLLYSSKSDIGAYILLPVGDNYSKIQEAVKNIFE